MPYSKDLFDFVIVGSGIVGLSTAWEIKRRYPAAKILVLEKELAPGRHASGRNSGVLHSGIYYPSHTLKARVCAEGAREMKAFARQEGIACHTWGKVIVASSSEDLPAVDRLLKNAQENGIRTEKLDEKGIKAIEPHARVHQYGIYCADTAVIDSRGVLEKLLYMLKQQGVVFQFEQEVQKVDCVNKIVATPRGAYGFGFLFNCAGAYADRVARLFGLCRRWTLLPFKGLYYKLDPKKNHLVRSSIYPVPNLLFPFLGVHLTRVVSGDVYVGPTAIPALGRENYGIFEGLRFAEAASVGWHLMRLYLKNEQNFRALVHVEMAKYGKRSFWKGAAKLVEGLEEADLHSCSKVGIRPQLIDKKTGRLEMDYILEREQNSLHVLNAISPAFTGSFAFARLIVDRFEEKGAEYSHVDRAARL